MSPDRAKYSRSSLSGLEEARDLSAIVTCGADLIAQAIVADVIEVVVYHDGSQVRGVARGPDEELTPTSGRKLLLSLSLARGIVSVKGMPLPLPLVVHGTAGMVLPPPMLDSMLGRGVSAIAVVPLEYAGERIGWVQACVRTPAGAQNPLYSSGVHGGWRASEMGQLFALVEQISLAAGNFCVRGVAARESRPSGHRSRRTRRAPSQRVDPTLLNPSQRLLEEVPFPAFLLSSEGVLLEGNSEFERNFGPLVGASGRSLLDLGNQYFSGTQAQAILTTLEQLKSQSLVYQRCDWNGEGQLSARGDHTVHVFRLAGSEEGARFSCVILPSGRRSFQSKLLEAKLQYRRLTDYARVVVIRTDANLTILTAAGEVSRIMGIQPYALMHTKLLGNEDIARLIPRTQRAKVMRKFRRYLLARIPLQEDIQIEQPNGQGMRWLSLMVLPHYGDAPQEEDSRSSDTPDTDTVFLGWEIIATDVTDTKRIDEERVLNKRRLHALYRMARALEFGSEPRLVTERGLHALIEATGAQCGYVTLFDRGSSHLEVVASHGLPIKTVEMLESRIQGGSLTRSIIETGQGVLIDDLPNDSRYKGSLLAEQGIRSAIVVPLIDDELPLGAVSVYSNDTSRFTQGDFDFAFAAASQISIAARRAEFYITQKRQADSYAALYRLSHEVSKHLSPKDIGQASFPIIQDELACKRMWLGVVNEAGSHLVGQVGVGSGMRKPIQTLRVELRATERLLLQALESGEPVIVEPQSAIECTSLTRISRALELGTLIVVPLKALSHTVGVLVVEPLNAGAFFAQKKLPLLSSMATELATVILARRFEEKMATSEKMRAAGVLASGVAHNFNNLLQAVMGQASLIELQSPKDTTTNKAAANILVAAQRGTALIDHLLHFSPHRPDVRKVIDLGAMVRESSSYYRALLGASTKLSLELPPQPLTIHGDQELLQQVMTTILTNARDAISARDEAGRNEEAEVAISIREIEVGPGDFEGNLLPGFYVRVDLQDSGRGMAPEEEARCFEPFFTTKNVDSRLGIGIGGAGLGLSTAYSVLRHHGGYVTVTSESGKGTVFSVFLPRATSASVGGGRDAGVSQDPGVYEVILLGFSEEEGHGIAVRFEAQGVSVMSGRSVRELSGECATARVLIADIDTAHFDIDDLMTTPASLHICLVTEDVVRWQGVRVLNRERFEVIGKPLDVWKIHAITRRVLEQRAGAEGVAILEDSVNGYSSGNGDV